MQKPAPSGLGKRVLQDKYKSLFSDRNLGVPMTNRNLPPKYKWSANTECGCNSDTANWLRRAARTGPGTAVQLEISDRRAL